MIRCQQSRATVVYRSITDVCLDSPALQHLLMTAFLPVLLPDPQKRRGDMCLFAKGTLSFFILLSKSKDRVDSVFSLAVCGAELGNAASQESERITGSQVPVPGAPPLASVQRFWDSAWMAAMTRLMKGKYIRSVSSRCGPWGAGESAQGREPTVMLQAHPWGCPA